MSKGRDFTVNLSAFIKKGRANMDAVVRKIVLDMSTSIVMRSPVGDGTLWKNPPPKGYIGGRFRANWQYGNMAEPSGELPDIDPSGQASIARITAGLPPIGAAGMVHMIRNNLPYSERLETGWSKQASAGMVGLTVVEFASTVEAAVRAINK